MTYSTVNDLIMLFNISLKALYFDNISLIIGCFCRKTDCGCDQEGRKLSWATRAEEVGFEVLPKRCNRGTV